VFNFILFLTYTEIGHHLLRCGSRIDNTDNLCLRRFIFVEYTATTVQWMD